MIVTTTPTVEGHRIAEYRGIVVGERVFQTLPMAFAVEAPKLVTVSPEGSAS